MEQKVISLLLALSGIAASTAAVPSAYAVEESPGADVPGDDERDDDSRKFEVFWFDASGGYEFVNLRTFEASNEDRLTGDLLSSAVSGPGVDLGLGFRLLTITLGARGKVVHLNSAGPVQDADLWSLDGELAFRLPVAAVEPYFMLGAGYSALGGVRDAVSGVNDGLDITGANVRAGLGLDYFVTPTLSIGARATGEILFLNRKGVPIRDLATPESVDTVGEAKARALEADGSSAGSAFGFFVGPGLHF